ncbi:TlpA family protein disulfide reductase [Aestuariibaculum sediminum]|uniref:TlpA family protein disulfide reductase n=1 Tax=Aestuariibaculum sediminum TaxID=2770637 RepID=A0A8J6PXZ3_9FLAO|nr:TlpA disulfide reductase family protein [Aestuariibaculum sediminum]MBD0830543.1 TlpA family protein disulfide reductase [Aestuariibaculum sediminum]
MKRQFLFVLASALFLVNVLHATTKTTQTTITGHFNFKPKTNKITLQYVVNGKAAEHSTTSLSSNGDFGFQLPVDQPGFYYLDYGQNERGSRGQVIRFYLEAGLDLKIDVNETHYLLKGSKTGKNSLVQKANEIHNKFRVYNKLGGAITYKDFFPFLENEGVEMVENFKKLINTKDEAFNKLLKLAVQSDFENELYYFFRLPRMAHPKQEEHPQLYKDMYVSGIKFSDPDILKLDNGLTWMNGYCYYFNRFFPSVRMDKVDIIDTDLKSISHEALKEVYIMDALKSLRLKPEEYKKVMPPLYQYLTSEESKNYIVEYEKDMHKEVGQPGFEFEYQDVNDKPVSFNDFKGKYLYIDLWATWCKPCKNEIPFLKELEHDYKGKDIVFMSISLDKPEDIQKWKDFVNTESLGGVQLMVDNAFSSGIAKNYEVRSIPRFLLFDKEGKIISTDALRPSNKLIREQFDSLLKQKN